MQAEMGHTVFVQVPVPPGAGIRKVRAGTFFFLLGHFAELARASPTSTSTSPLEHLPRIACTWTGHPGKLEI
jgi:hypothetical protein